MVGVADNCLFVDYLFVGRFWNTEPQLSVVRETTMSLSLPLFTPTCRDLSTTTVSEIHDYVDAVVHQQPDPSASCGAQLSSRLLLLF